MRFLFLMVVVPPLMLLLSACKEGPPVQAERGEHREAGGVGTAVEGLKAAADNSPADLETLIRLGNLLMDSGRFEEAAGAYEEALRLDPMNGDVRTDLATCYRNSGSPERAVEEYRRVLEQDPGHRLARRNLAVVLAYDLGRIGEAVEEFKGYLEASPDAPDAAQVKEVIRELMERSAQDSRDRLRAEGWRR